jgi:hypothetical protein
MIEVMVPAGPTAEFRLDLLNKILESFLVLRDGRWTFCLINNNDTPPRSDLLRMIIDTARRRGRLDAMTYLARTGAVPPQT